MKKTRKEIVKLGWGVKWRSGKIEFFNTKRRARHETAYWPSSDSILFRCKIEELTK